MPPSPPHARTQLSIITLALETYGNKVAGHPVEAVYVDIQSNAQATVSAMTELLEQKKVDIVIGPIASSAVSWATPPWRQRKPIWIVPGSSSTRNEGQLGEEKYFFHPYPWAYDYHKNLANMMKHYIGGGKRLAIIYSDGVYGRAHINHARRYFKKAGFNIVLEELVREGAADLSPALLKVRRAKPDVLMGIVQTADAILLTKQIKAAKLNVPYLVGTVYATLKEWQESTGEAGEGWISVTSWEAGMKRPANPKYPKLFPNAKDWEEKFHAKFGRDPIFLDPLSYVSTMMLLLAIERAGGMDRDKVVAELEKMDEPTFYGRARYSRNDVGTMHQAFSDMVVIQRQNGKSVIIYPVDVADGKLLQAPR